MGVANTECKQCMIYSTHVVDVEYPKKVTLLEIPTFYFSLCSSLIFPTSSLLWLLSLFSLLPLHSIPYSPQSLSLLSRLLLLFISCPSSPFTHLVSRLSVSLTSLSVAHTKRHSCRLAGHCRTNPWLALADWVMTIKYKKYGLKWKLAE